ncbi:MAG: acyl-CoA dehydrogenase family protein, partial [Nanoarchaeota archaeon]|nr:acyl-CoA dehydrogenase family protein [Nanoarchaeota archaeon]
MSNKKQQESLDVAEDSREKDWLYPSFTAEIFKGNFNWNLINPFPLQSYEDKKIGDNFIKKLDKCLKENINPHEVDKNGKVPKKALEELAKIGTFGIKIPKKYGGLGMSISNYNRIMSHVGKYCGSTAVWLSAHQSIGVPEPLIHFGTTEQKNKYLPELAKGAISAFALTEPGVGSDPANMKTTAIPSEDGKHYILNGEKMWITNGPDSKYLIVMAKTPSIFIEGEEKKQITAFILDTSQKGFSVSHKCKFMGIRGISNGLLKFNNIKIPIENIIGKPGQGLKIAFVTLNTGRLSIPSISAGTSKECLKYLRKWTNERIQWGIPIGKHEAVSDMLFEMTCNTFAMESITKYTSALADKGNADIRLEAAMAKYFASETAWKILDDALQIRGGRGYEN